MSLSQSRPLSTPSDKYCINLVLLAIGTMKKLAGIQVDFVEALYESQVANERSGCLIDKFKESSVQEESLDKAIEHG